jgi:hypothetical protein
MNMSNVSMRLRLTLAAIGLALASAAFAQEPVVIREGSGEHRRDCDKKELKPFDATAWSKLSEWTNGPALTPGDYNGKVVLIVTWKDWYEPSVRALKLAKRLADARGKDGLVVVGAHDPQGWKEAKKPAGEKDSVFLLAYDAKGEFRAAVGQDQDPDFFVIDRAGQMRYCDISTESVEGAVDFLLKEKTDQAAGVNARLASEAAAKDAERRRTEAIRKSIDLTSLPEVPFTMPGPEAYKGLNWPKMPRDENAPPEDPKNPDPPVSMGVPDVGFWPSKPQMQGRAILMYFWHPDVPQTFAVMQDMDRLQRQHGRDVVVIGVVCPIKTDNGQELKLDMDADHIQKRIDDFKARYRLGHTFLIDLSGTLLAAASGRNSSNKVIHPYLAMISSDNTLRWAGYSGKPESLGAFDRILEIDPGVNARRRAEAAFISSKMNK